MTRRHDDDDQDGDDEDNRQTDCSNEPPVDPRHVLLMTLSTVQSNAVGLRLLMYNVSLKD